MPARTAYGRATQHKRPAPPALSPNDRPRTHRLAMRVCHQWYKLERNGYSRSACGGGAFFIRVVHACVRNVRAFLRAIDDLYGKSKRAPSSHRGMKMHCRCSLVVVSLAMFARAEDSGCPCTPFNTSALNTTRLAVVGNSIIEYPADYGLEGCATYDTGLAPYCDVDAPPSYCAQSWCYVDTNVCHRSSINYYASGIFPDSTLFYSYDTCGSDDGASEWDDINNAASLSGTVLRVAVPAITYPDHYWLDDDGGIISGIAGNVSRPYVGLYIEVGITHAQEQSHNTCFKRSSVPLHPLSTSRPRPRVRDSRSSGQPYRADRSRVTPHRGRPAWMTSPRASSTCASAISGRHRHAWR